MNLLPSLIDWILFVPLALCVGYLLLFAIASRFYRAPHYPPTEVMHRFAVLFPAYKEDRVIVDSVRSFLEQDYPKECFDIIVISDRMSDATNEALRQLPVRLLVARYENSSKAKAMKLAMEQTLDEAYDMVVVMDADNVTVPHFLAEANRAYAAGCNALQARRTGKNLNTSIALLDSISEEINNAFFRSGHNALGLSAGLAGSGMVFDADWFRHNVTHLHTAGEDKELEALLLRQRVHISYLPQLPVYDEKTQQAEAIKNQRKRWIAAQFGALRTSLPHFGTALLQGNFDYCDKVLQWMLPPRLVQLAAVFGLTILVTLIYHEAGTKWLLLSLAQIAAMWLPVPRRLFGKELFKAMLHLPRLAWIMVGNLFGLKGANHSFIHTKHGEPENTDAP
ncbi:glycosyltransferase [Bacteroides sp.]|uniref:glycosyltransferase n=1 Tax=Bacteroides sp. TaxID=29523 RepID=UPI002FC9CD2D